jgi:hypothetical protein
VAGLLARKRDCPLFQTICTFSGALLRAPSLELKQLVCETGHLPPYIDEVKNEWSCVSVSHFVPARHAQGHLYFNSYTPWFALSSPTATSVLQIWNTSNTRSLHWAD